MKNVCRSICLALVVLMMLSSAVLPIVAATETESISSESEVSLEERNLWGASTPGFLNADTNQETRSDSAYIAHFVTSDRISVQKGDKITFGPIPSNLRVGQNNPYVILGYDNNGKWTENPYISNLVEEHSISDYWKIYTYEVTKDTTTNIRISTTSQFPYAVATKNYVFTDEEYLAYAKKKNIDTSIIVPVDYDGTYENLFAVSDSVKDGYMNSNGFTESDSYRQRTFDDVKAGDVFYIMIRPTESGHFIFEKYSDNSSKTIRPNTGELPIYADLGGGYAVFRYVVASNVTSISIHPKEAAKYEAGLLLVTKNQPFTKSGYRKAMGLTLTDADNLWDGGQRGFWADYNVIDSITAEGDNSLFFTSNAIDIDLKAGDTITFGPFRENTRTNSNPYIAIGYNEEDAYIGGSQIYTYGDSCNTTVEFTMVGNLKFYSFTAKKDYDKIRFVTVDGLGDYTVVTKNNAFTKREYLEYMASRGKDVSFLTPEFKDEPLVNLYEGEKNSKAGYWFVNENAFCPTGEDNAWDRRTYEFTVAETGGDLKPGDVVYIASSNVGNLLFIAPKGDGTIDFVQSYFASIPIGNGFSIYAYRVQPDVKTLAVSVQEASYDQGEILMTVNQPFTAEQYLKYLGVDLERDQVKMNPNSPLNGLKGLFMGDSISRGSHDVQTLLDNPDAWRSWAGGIAASTGLIATNPSVSGARMSYHSHDTAGHWIYNQMEPYLNEDFDIVVMQGGVNDSNSGRQAIGAPLPITSTKEELLEKATETILGPNGKYSTSYIAGLQLTFHTVREEFPDATLFFIANYKLANPDFSHLGEYFEAAKEVCEMYGVHYIDLYGNDEITRLLKQDTVDLVHDRLHPNKTGYDIITPYIQREIEAVMCGEATHDFSAEGKDETHHYTACKYCGVSQDSTKVEHIYDNNCDPDCNDCGYVRIAPHSYANECASVCSDCPHERVAPHVYTDLCDAECNACPQTRIPPHDFNKYEHNETQHWKVCECGEETEKTPHNYTDDCDATCDSCNRERIAPHNYNIEVSSKTQHWTQCACGLATEKIDHEYDSACDDVCNTCNFKRTAPHDYSIHKHTETQHWSECQCGEKISAKESHVFGEWVTEGETQSRSCSCGYTESQPTENTGNIKTSTIIVIAIVCGIALLILCAAILIPLLSKTLYFHA